MNSNDWIAAAVTEISMTTFPTDRPSIAVKMMEIIQRHCPFKSHTAYVEVDQSAQKFLRKLVDLGDWYASAIELDVHHGQDGEELWKEAKKILGDPPA